jgi:hypothetical protein
MCYTIISYDNNVVRKIVWYFKIHWYPFVLFRMNARSQGTVSSPAASVTGTWYYVVLFLQMDPKSDKTWISETEYHENKKCYFLLFSPRPEFSIIFII